MRKLFVLSIALTALIVAPLMAQEMTVEIPSADGRMLATCDHLHAMDGASKCNIYHYTNPDDDGGGGGGDPSEENNPDHTVMGNGNLPVVQLDGRDHVISWMGPGYYLEGGLVIRAAGDAESIKGQQWLEISPRGGQTHTSDSWNDVNGDGVLSLSDSIVIDGHALRVKDVRLQAVVSPLSQ